MSMTSPRIHVDDIPPNTAQLNTVSHSEEIAEGDCHPPRNADDDFLECERDASTGHAEGHRERPELIAENGGDSQNGCDLSQERDELPGSITHFVVLDESPYPSIDEPDH
jgi:hypothetical protein